MSSGDANDSSSGESTGIASLKGVTLLGSQPGQSGHGKADRYYIQRRSGKVFGPFEKSLIRQMIEGNKLSGDEGVSTDKQVWLPILSIPDFSDLFEERRAKDAPRTMQSVDLSGADLSSPGLTLEPVDPSPTIATRRATSPGLPGPGPEGNAAGGLAVPEEPEVEAEPGFEPNVHEEPTRAFSDSSIEDLMSSQAPLPPLSELPMPDPLDFDVSQIPGVSSPGKAPTSSMPELPMPPGLSQADSEAAGDEREASAPSGRAAEQSSRPPRPSLSRPRQVEPELPMPVSATRPELPALKPRPSIPELPGLEPAGADGPELPLPKAAAEPELPAPKRLPPMPELGVPNGSDTGPELPMPVAASTPELPLSKAGPSHFPELPLPKSSSRPELPLPLGAAERAAAAQLPRPKGLAELPLPKSMSELPLPKSGQAPQLPLPKTGAELPILADGLDLLGRDGVLPELPTSAFQEVHLPTLHDSVDESLDMDDLLANFDTQLDGEFDLELPSPPGATGDFLLGDRRATRTTFSGLDGDLLPPPTAGYGDDDPPLSGFGTDQGGPDYSNEAVLVESSPGEAILAAGGGSLAARTAAGAEAPARPRRTKRARKARPALPRSRVILLALLLIVVAGAGLFLSGVFDGSDDFADLEGGTASTTPDDDPVVLARAETVELTVLRPGNYGDILSFLQPAAAAVQAAPQDRDAIARLLVGQSLMTAQYGEDPATALSMSQRAATLEASDEPLHRLARGAFAASQGQPGAAEAALTGLDGTEHAALAELFLGVAYLERYERDLAEGGSVAPDEPVAPDQPSDGESDGSEATPEGTQDGGETAEAESPPADTPEPDATRTALAVAELGPAVLDPAARGHFENAVRLDPELVPAHYFLGVDALKRGQADDARAAFEAALDIQPNHYPSLLALTRLLMSAGEFEDASRRLVLVTDSNDTAGSDRERSDVHHLLGRLAEIRRQFDQAGEALERAFTADPSNHEAMRDLARLLHSTGQHQRAVDFFNQHAPDPSAPELVLALSESRIEQAQEASDANERQEILTGLVAELETAREANPEDPRFPYTIGQVRLAQNLFDEADAAFQQSVELDDGFRPAYLSLAELASLSNESEQAYQYLVRASQTGEPDTDLELALGEAYDSLGRSNEATDAYRQAVDVDPHNMEARLHLARHFVARGDRHGLQSALSQLEAVEAAGVDDPELHALFAEVQYGLGNLNLARERMNRVAVHNAEETDPDHLYLLGRINFDAGELATQARNPEEATRYYETARQNFNASYLQGRDSPEARYWEGRALLALNELDRAVPTFRRAIDQTQRAGEQPGEYQFWLGYGLEQAGDYQQALEAYVLVDRWDLRWALAHPALYFHRGRLYSRSRLFRRAKRDLEWALILDQAHAQAAAELAEVHYLEQRLDSAIELWRQSLAINPDQSRVHYRLGETFLRLEEYRDCIEHFERARDMGYGEREPTLFRTLGFLYRDVRRNSDAIRELSRYLDSGAVQSGSPEDIEIRNEIRRMGGPR